MADRNDILRIKGWTSTSHRPLNRKQKEKRTKKMSVFPVFQLTIARTWWTGWLSLAKSQKPWYKRAPKEASLSEATCESFTAGETFHHFTFVLFNTIIESNSLKLISIPSQVGHCKRFPNISPLASDWLKKNRRLLSHLLRVAVSKQIGKWLDLLTQ